MQDFARFGARFALVGVLTIALASGMALAQGGRGAGGDGNGPRDGRTTMAQRMIEFLDIDGDGAVSLEEIAAEQDRLFMAADVDGDGKLSVEEFRRRGEWFQRMRTTTLFDLSDADGDSAIVPDEIKSPSARWFARYDANGDGKLEASELPKRSWRRGRR